MEKVSAPGTGAGGHGSADGLSQLVRVVSQTEGQRMMRGLSKGVGSAAAMVWEYIGEGVGCRE
jgi:hypothetical protein